MSSLVDCDMAYNEVGKTNDSMVIPVSALYARHCFMTWAQCHSLDSSLFPKWYRMQYLFNKSMSLIVTSLVNYNEAGKNNDSMVIPVSALYARHCFMTWAQSWQFYCFPNGIECNTSSIRVSLIVTSLVNYNEAGKTNDSMVIPVSALYARHCFMALAQSWQFYCFPNGIECNTSSIRVCR